MIVVAIALEIENSIDDVLKRFRPGDRAFLGNVAREKYGRRGLFGKHHELGCDLPHLRNAAGCGFDLFAENGLNRIDDDKIGPQLVGFG